MDAAAEREFWMGMRYGLLKQLEAIEKTHLPEKWQERVAFKKWLEANGRKPVT